MSPPTDPAAVGTALPHSSVARRGPQITRTKVGIGMALAAILIFGWLTNRWFLHPDDSSGARSDAVVVLSGGDGERLSRALELIDAGLSSRLVLSTGAQRWSHQDELLELCEAGLPDVEITCLVATPDDTAGEAATIARLAERREWEDLTLVTSSYHLHRAALWFDRCFIGTVHPVAADAQNSVGRVGHEWLGVIEAMTLRRGCQ